MRYLFNEITPKGIAKAFRLRHAFASSGSVSRFYRYTMTNRLHLSPRLSLCLTHQPRDGCVRQPVTTTDAQGIIIIPVEKRKERKRLLSISGRPRSQRRKKLLMLAWQARVWHLILRYVHRYDDHASPAIYRGHEHQTTPECREKWAHPRRISTTVIFR